MELSDLRIFLRVFDSGSLSSAARTIGLPKSSVSRALNRLESDVGAALLDRSGRRVKMTDAGLALQPHAASLLAAAEEAQASVDSTSGLLRGSLKVNVPFALAAVLLAPMLTNFLKRYPDLRHIKVEDGPGRRLGRSFRVKLWPTLILMRGGQETGRVVRPTTAREISELLAG